MTDIASLRPWLILCLVLAAIAATAIPVMYSFFPWRSRPIGRLFMLQAVAYSLALDSRILLWIWTDNKVAAYWINVVVLAVVAIATFAMAGWMLSKVLLIRKDPDDAAQQ